MADFSFPDYTKIFKPGIDLSTGKRDVDPWRQVRESSSFDPSQFLASSSTKGFEDKSKKDRYVSTFGADLPALNEEWAQKVAASVALNQALQPMALEQAKRSAELQAWLTDQQIRQYIPVAQAVQAQNIAQNLAASKEFASYLKRPEIATQSILESKQGQMASAGTTEASLKQATALQQDAAKRFAGSFAGKYIQAA